ncbi:3'-5' exonuclease [Sorochytrium milnesiophthora]
MPDDNWKKLLQKIKPEAFKAATAASKAPKKRPLEEEVVVGQEPAQEQAAAALATTNDRDTDDEELDFFDAVESKQPKVSKLVALSTAKPTTVQGWFDHYASTMPVSETALNKAGKFVAVSCKVVDVGAGRGYPVLARVSVVNFHGRVLYDAYVQPKEKVVDYRESVSGIRAQDLASGSAIEEVTRKVSDLIKGRVVVGYSLYHDFKVMFLDHPSKQMRDLSLYRAIQPLRGKGPTSLKDLAKSHLHVDARTNSVEEARVCMLLYRLFRERWEASLVQKPKTGVAESALSAETPIATATAAPEGVTGDSISLQKAPAAKKPKTSPDTQQQQQQQQQPQPTSRKNFWKKANRTQKR